MNFYLTENFFSYGTFEDELIEQISKYEEYIDDLLSLKKIFPTVLKIIKIGKLIRLLIRL